MHKNTERSLYGCQPLHWLHDRWTAWRLSREPETGVEPATCCLQDSCSAELSYSGGTARFLRVMVRDTAVLVVDIDEAI